MSDSVRVDKWLWAARCFKTRSQATEACVTGHVRVNDEPAKAAKLVRVGDTVTARTPGGERILKVAALDDKRGPAEVAQALYEDLTPPPEPKLPWQLFEAPAERREAGAGRPTKRDRRLIDHLKEV
jgi:ribosome-associated heat shock protein Hsp15